MAITLDDLGGKDVEITLNIHTYSKDEALDLLRKSTIVILYSHPSFNQPEDGKETVYQWDLVKLQNLADDAEYRLHLSELEVERTFEMTPLETKKFTIPEL